VISQDFIRVLANYGYKMIRLPVTWAEHLGPGPDYAIEKKRLARVEKVVNWCLDDRLYMIVNLHHDGGESQESWILGAAANPEGAANNWRRSGHK
jgi:aryl-phospho-beta-D-glucosidase BglC (GH1 family)